MFFRIGTTLAGGVLKKCSASMNPLMNALTVSSLALM